MGMVWLSPPSNLSSVSPIAEVPSFDVLKDALAQNPALCESS